MDAREGPSIVISISVLHTLPIVFIALIDGIIYYCLQDLWQYGQVQYGNTITSVHYTSQSMIVHTSGLVYIAEPIY